MNTSQLNKQSMHRAAVAVLTTLPEGSYPPGLAARMAELRTKQIESEDVIARQTLQLGTAIAVRDAAFEAMVDATAFVAGLVLGHARANGLAVLASRVRFRVGAVKRQRFQRQVQTCQQIATALRDELPALVSSGLTAAMLDDLEAKIAAATAASVEPRNAVVTKRAATEHLPLVLREIDQILRLGIDPIVYSLRHAYPDFHARYRAARETVDHPATRDTSEPAAPVGVASAGQPADAGRQPLAA